MKIYAISDLHLSLMVEKPMDIFGGNWENYTDKIKANWEKIVKNDDLVLIAGDISWAMKMEETKKDLQFIENLPGKKIIIKGNHEYWWHSISKVRAILPESIFALQNDCIRFGDMLITGTRGWDVPDGNIENNMSADDIKIYEREVIRLRLALEDMKKQRKEGDKVICMMHYPPFTARVEDTLFTALFEEYKVDAVVYGHIHQNPGKYKKITEKNGIKYYLTSADLIGMVPVEIII